MKMDETDLLRFLEAEAAAAYHHASGTIAQEREATLRAYLRKPYGTEQEGRSAVVASDVFDSVEGQIPDLIEVFVSTDKAVVFDPIGPEDVKGAEQATTACNHVFYKANNGFLILYTAAKDALLSKTGSVKWYWDYKDTPTFTTYRDVPEMQLATFLATNPTAEVMSKEEAETPPELAQEAAMMGLEPPKVFASVKIKTVEKKGKVCIVNIPPDELQISARHNSVLLQDCPYVAHVAEKTLSELLQMGFDVDADDVKAAASEPTTQDRALRDSHQGGRYGWWKDEAQELDESRIKGWLREEYVLTDFDGDGIAERRQIFRLGKKILGNVEVSHVPIAAWTPYIITHQFTGFSSADLTEDFQRISTDIWRAQLDNLDQANNQESVVLTDSQGNPLANIDDLLNRRPGGIMREQVAGAIRPYQQRWQGIEAMPMIANLEERKQRRTGYVPFAGALDADALNKTAMQVSKESNSAMSRTKLMARIMAECLVAPMFRGIFKTLTDYGMEKLSFRINNEFVEYDPQEWRDGYDMSINVGIGTGDRAQQAAYLANISQVQLSLMNSPLAGRVVTEGNIYALQARIAENAGFKNPAEFWTDPTQVPPPQPQPNPEQIKAQAEAQKLQFQAAQAKELKQMDLQDSAMKFQAEMQMQKEVDANRQEWEARQKTLELQMQAQLEAQKQQFETEREQLRLAFEKWRVEFEAGLDMQKHSDSLTMQGMSHAREDMRQERAEAAAFQVPTE
jgi:hypothetical protein